MLKRKYGARVNIIDLPRLTIAGAAIVKRLGGTEGYDRELGRNAGGRGRQHSLNEQTKRARGRNADVGAFKGGKSVLNS